MTTPLSRRKLHIAHPFIWSWRFIDIRQTDQLITAFGDGTHLRMKAPCRILVIAMKRTLLDFLFLVIGYLVAVRIIAFMRITRIARHL